MLYYVDCQAAYEGDGSKNRPFRAIQDAAELAKPGDAVLVAPGTYREHVCPKYAGTEQARITYRSTEPYGAVITGAEKLANWTYDEKNKIWMSRIDNGIFGNYNPYKTEVYGDWYFASNVQHTGCVYLNDRKLYEVESLEECIEGKKSDNSWEPQYSVYKWYTEQQDGQTLIYANFQDKNPNQETVEINVRRNCFMPGENNIGYITVSGFVMTKAATTWAPPAAYQDGLIGPHWSKGWIIEDCEISNSRCVGISLGKYLDPENEQYFTARHVKSPTQMERDAVCRGQYHGWSKEKIGSHTIRRCNIHDCGQAGIVGRMGGVFSLIENNEIHHINNMQDLGGAEIAGIKLHAAIDVVMRRNHIHHCTMGIWCDWEAQGTRISQNLLHDNMAPEGLPCTPGMIMSQDIFVEVGHGPTLIDNNVLLSKVSLRIPTQGLAIVHNLVCGPLCYIDAGCDSIVNGKNEPRYTPYHIRHRTEVAGFMTILHGDDRFYNNVFIQQWPVASYQNKESANQDVDNKTVGTSVFDGYPTYKEWIATFDLKEARPDMGKLAPWHFGHLPVWAGGNAYFNGAKAWDKEKENVIVGDKVDISLVEEHGALSLRTDLYAKMGAYTCGIINSDILGKAFEPDQRFENPDGTSITFNRDFLGAHRGISTLPGPFADPGELEQPIWRSNL